MTSPVELVGIADRREDRPAVIMAATGQSISFSDLEAASNRLAHLIRSRKLRRGDGIAVLLENNIRYVEICFAAFRAGLYVTGINRFLTPAEAAYIVADCDARLIISSRAMAATAAGLLPLIPDCPHRLMVDGAIEGWERYEDAVATFPQTPITDESRGALMYYSSGTTGRPKGIRPALQPDPAAARAHDRMHASIQGWDAGTVYLSPAPIYHAAPLGSVICVVGMGGTAIIMEKFDPIAALEAIERYRVTHAQWVPTMFVRMLKAPPEVRSRYDISSMKVATHAAAPCPPEIKQNMIEWWGPIVCEYYSASEGMGMTFADSAEWLAHPGTVGRPRIGILHICDDEGADVPVGTAGTIYFERDRQVFEYWKDAEATRAAQHPDHPFWTTVGDVGYVDEDGYLYLTGRKSFMIISGGVNIYPEAIEHCLILHPAVGDVAVIGVPDSEMGEVVKAVVELVSPDIASDALAEELRTFVRARIAPYMVPRSVEFVDALPRLPTGKLYKRVLYDRYRPGAGAGASASLSP